jgi:protein-L-isoaspartate(D-aspartate) O-methyltransferase
MEAAAEAQQRALRLLDELKERGCVRSDRVADAFAVVPRERFLPAVALEQVYRVDEAIPTHFDAGGVPVSSSSAPSIMAVMLEMLTVGPGQRVLEIGAGTGYNAALLAQLAGPHGSVTSVDIDPAVTEEAAANLGRATAVHVVTGDGWLGRPDETFDRTMVTVECWDIAPAWVEQLAEGGVIVLPLWLRPGLSLAVAFEKTGDVLVSRAVAYCGFMPLRGPHGGPNRRALLHDVPWDEGDDANRRRWLALMDEATDARDAVLQSLLRRPGTVRPAPPSFAGWNLRVTLEEPDPICVITMFPPLRQAIGLFDAARHGLAVLEGESLLSYGDPSCGERLVSFLSAPRPLDLSALTITAVRHGSLSREAGGNGGSGGDGEDVLSVIARPSHDLVVSARRPTASPG